MSDLRATMIVARREFLERVRTKWFVAATVLGPLFMIAMVVVPAWIARSSTAGTKIDIIDRSTGQIGEQIATALRAEQWDVAVVDPATTEDSERQRIEQRAIQGCMVIDAKPLDGGPITYFGENASNQSAQRILVQTVTTVVWAARAKRDANLSEPQLEAILRKPQLSIVSTTGTGSGTGAFLVSYILAVILYMVITLYGVAVMRSVVTEKASRVMELMVAAVKPRSLMAGKILGVGGAGLLQVAIWLSIGALTLAYRDVILSWFGISGGGAIPPFALGEVVVSLVFFVLGYFFYAAMYAAVGAMVSQEQDTQQVQMPITMVLVIGLLCLQVVSNAPRGSTTTIMSNLPFWSPILMPMRFVLGGASAGEVVISLAILIVTTAAVVRLAARIYRVGVLMYGKRPTLAELARWLRH